MNDIFNVKIARKAERELKKLPVHIVIKLMSWIDSVGHVGLRETVKAKGYHDEPLQGKRKGQRSIRLSKSYRAIYIIEKDGRVEFVEVQEVNKHEY
jgi:toxin HigB-1